nr:hypothetical protein [Salinicola tamaricis]
MTLNRPGKVELLEDVAAATALFAAGPEQAPTALHVAIQHPDMAVRLAVGAAQADEVTQQGRLARPRRPDQRDQLAGVDLETDLAQRRMGAEGFVEPFDANDGSHTIRPGKCRP